MDILVRTGRFWVRSPFRSLARSTNFASLSVSNWIVIRNLFTALTGQYVVSENS